MRESYLSYAMSVIASRALPDVRDGLKPVQRRILYAMREMNLTPDKQHRKCAGVIGEVLKNYHPHGDSSVYDALVRMAQDFTLRYPLIDPHGNFGSIDGDRPAAYRYTEARLARIAMEMLADIDKDTVDFIPNFDSQGTEPTVLPSRLPQLLVNGSSGIAVGMATNIPPHNIGEISDAIAYLVDHDDDSADELDRALADIVQGPDFPTGGSLMGKEAIRQAYRTGRGSIVMRGKAEIVEERGRHRIIITEVPFQVTTARIVEAIAEAHEQKSIVGICELAERVRSQGHAHRRRAGAFGYARRRPELAVQAHAACSRASASTCWRSCPCRPRFRGCRARSSRRCSRCARCSSTSSRHRKTVIRRRTEYDLTKARERAHVLEGFRIALDNIEEVIAIIRNSDSTEIARERLVARFTLSVRAGQRDPRHAFADARRPRTRQDRGRVPRAAQDDRRTRRYLGESRAASRRSCAAKSEDIKKRFGDPRRTQIVPLEDEFAMEDMIADTDVVVTSTVGGYIKRVSVDTFRAQNRGGRGVTGIANLKREDVVQNFFMASTHQHVLFFTNKGRAYRLRGYEIPDSTRQARGTALVNLLTLPPGEKVTAVFPVSTFDEERFLVMVTRRGVIKKTSLSEFANIRKSGLNAIDLDENDELLAVDLSDGSRDIIFGTREGMAVHFNEKDVRSMGRNARGVRAITLAPGDEVVAMDVEESERREVLIVTSQGFGKRTAIDDYRHTSRGGKGVKAFAREKNVGHVVDQILVKAEDEILLMTSGNQVIRIRASEIRKAGRSTKGVRLQRLEEGDEVIAVTNLGEQTKQIAEITGEAPAAGK